jgi:hypothetical protein
MQAQLASAGFAAPLRLRARNAIPCGLGRNLGIARRRHGICHLIGLLKTIVAALLGLALGLTATWYAVGGGLNVGSVELGPWRGNPRAAYADADPYTRAMRARSGQSPLSQAEGLSFFAASDDSGDKLNPRCDYVISGAMPAARAWTLSSIDSDGRPVPNTTGRNAITSVEVVRDQNARIEVVAAAQARAGNWLPLAADQPFKFMLRLYDTAGSAAVGVMSREQMPSIRRGSCS